MNERESFLTEEAASPPRAATPRVLNRLEPETVPIPISDSVTNVPTTFTNSSGADVAVAMNVAAATFYKNINNNNPTRSSDNNPRAQEYS